MKDALLQPYAVHAVDVRGRLHPETTPAGADPFELDRRRIVHSTAFRRLQFKTQVFIAGEHDHFRTRLTHTLEVVDVARRLAGALGANAALAEVIALAHDLGHPPFGHAGEQALAERMAGHGGFEHNAQSLRVVEYLEHPYPPFRGLNLTYEVREGLGKHRTLFDRPVWRDSDDGPRASLEGQIACVADRIAYDCHDLEDAVGAKLVDAADLAAIPLWREVAESLSGGRGAQPLAAVRRPILDAIEDALIADVISESQARIRESRVETVADVRRWPEDLAAFSPAMLEKLGAIESFLAARLYRHRRVARMDEQAKRQVEGLFDAYLRAPGLLPGRYERRAEEQGLHRVICDYIAGMTDRFCREQYRRLVAA